jgi:hypothetical protein
MKKDLILEIERIHELMLNSSFQQNKKLILTENVLYAKFIKQLIDIGVNKVDDLTRYFDNKIVPDNLKNKSLKNLTEEEVQLFVKSLSKRGFARYLLDNGFISLKTQETTFRTWLKQLENVENPKEILKEIEVSLMDSAQTGFGSWGKNSPEEFLELGAEIGGELMERFEKFVAKESPDFFDETYEITKKALDREKWLRIWFDFFNEDAATVRRSLSRINAKYYSEKTQKEFVDLMRDALALTSKGQSAENTIRKATDIIISSKKGATQDMGALIDLYTSRLSRAEKRLFDSSPYGRKEIEDALNIALENTRTGNPKLWRRLVDAPKSTFKLFPPLRKGSTKSDWNLWMRSWVQYIIKLNPITAAQLKQNLIKSGTQPVVATYLANWIIGKFFIAPSLMALALSIKQVFKFGIDPNRNAYDEGYQSFADIFLEEFFNYAVWDEDRSFILNVLSYFTAIPSVVDVIRRILTFEAPKVPLPDDLESILGDCSNEIRQYTIDDRNEIIARTAQGQPTKCYYWGDLDNIKWPEDDNNVITKNNKGIWVISLDNKYFPVSEVVKSSPCGNNQNNQQTNNE